MRGPNTAIGFKLLVHHQEEVPLVKEFGEALPPGYHAFVSLTLDQVRTVLR